MNKPKFQTPDLTAENIAKLNDLFPNLISEGKVNLDALRSFVGEEVWERECYEFTWVGKRDAVAEAGKPIRKTLRPDREKSVNFDTTENLYIEGDNLDVLKLLQESYLGKVKMIYIDPPYNTGKDSFVYPDNYRVDDEEYEENIGLYDELGNKLFKENSNSNPRFHSDWCSMIYPRLVLARNLLRNDGVIFISIDDNEVAQLRKICDEVFGESNFMGIFVVNSTPNARDYGHIGKMHEYVLFYVKDAFSTQTNMLPEVDKSFKYNDINGGYNIHPLYNSNEAFTNKNRPNLFYPFFLYPESKIDKDFYEIGLDKREGAIQIYPPKSVKNGVQFVWRWGKEKAKTNLNIEIIGYKTSEGEYRIVQKMRHSEKLIRSLLTDTSYSSRRGTAEVEDILEGKLFDFPKPFSLLRDLVRVGASEDSIILDFFSGSATTAHAVMQLNAEDGGKRKFIMVQLPEECKDGTEAKKAGYETICDIGRARIRKAGEKIKADNLPARLGSLGTAELDTGFRVLRLDDTNMRDVYYNALEWAEGVKANGEQLNLEDMTDNVKQGRTAEDLLYGCLLEWGLPLNQPHVVEQISGFAVQNYNDGDLLACFEKNVTEALVRELAARCKERAPLTSRVVFRDDSFTNSPQKINLFEIFKLLAPNASVKVI